MINLLAWQEFTPQDALQDDTMEHDGPPSPVIPFITACVSILMGVPAEDAKVAINIINNSNLAFGELNCSTHKP
jgi:hypothetical protein